MVPISIVYDSALRCTATHDNSGATFITDAPKDNLGRGESFSPTDLVATALGSCMVTTMAIAAQRNKWHVLLDGTRVTVEKHMTTTLPRRIAKLVVRCTFPPGIAPEMQEKLRAAGDACPVALSLHPEVVQDVEYIF